MSNLVTDTLEFLVDTIGERPVGEPGNQKSNQFLLEQFRSLGYETRKIEFDCKLWEKGVSSAGPNRCYSIQPGPFSIGFEGAYPIALIESIEQLHAVDLKDKILLLRGDIAKNPLMPKDFPFFYPEEHKALIVTLEAKQPKAIIAGTGKHPFCGHSPFSLFEDGNFHIPNAYTDPKTVEKLSTSEGDLEVCIESNRKNGKSQQVFASRAGTNGKRIIVCAHVDTKHGTPGALDNATGVALLLQVMKQLRDYAGEFHLDFVPFNGEEYYGVGGQLAYLEHLNQQAEETDLVINIDGLGYKGSHNEVSLYNFSETRRKAFLNRISQVNDIKEGSQWPAGDHSIFSFRGIPCMVFTSEHLLSEVMSLTHTPDDNLDVVDPQLVFKAADFMTDWIVKMG